MHAVLVSNLPHDRRSSSTSILGHLDHDSACARSSPTDNPSHAERGKDKGPKRRHTSLGSVVSRQSGHQSAPNQSSLAGNCRRRPFLTGDDEQSGRDHGGPRKKWRGGPGDDGLTLLKGEIPRPLLRCPPFTVAPYFPPSGLKAD